MNIFKACYQSCYQNLVHLLCGCTDPTYPGIKNVKVCGIRDALCVLNITDTLGSSFTWAECNCPIKCSESEIDIEYNTAALAINVFYLFNNV